MVDIVYRTPSDQAWRCRQYFHECSKAPNESISEWYTRVESCLLGCEYDTLRDFMLIDKFVASLSHKVIGDVLKTRAIRIEDIQTLISTFEGRVNTQNAYRVSSDAECSGYYDRNPGNISLNSKIDKDEDPFESNDKLENINGSSIDIEDNFVKIEPEFVDIDDNTGHVERHISAVINDDTTDMPKSKENAGDHSLKKNPHGNSSTISEKKLKGFKKIGNDRVICLDCGKEYARTTYFSHRRWHTGELFPCEVCKKIFTTVSARKKHLKIHEDTGQTFGCYLCDYVADKYRTLRTHFTSKHCFNYNDEKEELYCKYCNKMFTSQKTLGIHEQIHEGLAESHKCPHCDMEFDQRPRLWAHLKTHIDTKRFVCETCGRGFNSTNRFQEHKRSHLSDKTIKSIECTVCGKILRSNWTHRQHMKIHTGEKSYQCTLCPEKFRITNQYLRHLRVHGIYNSVCNMCDKGFSSKYDLKIHMSVHTGARPYKCNECDKSFSQVTPLKNHKRKEHPQSEVGTVSLNKQHDYV